MTGNKHKGVERIFFKYPVWDSDCFPSEWLCCKRTLLEERKGKVYNDHHEKVSLLIEEDTNLTL